MIRVTWIMDLVRPQGKWLRISFFRIADIGHQLCRIHGLPVPNDMGNAPSFAIEQEMSFVSQLYAALTCDAVESNIARGEGNSETGPGADLVQVPGCISDLSQFKSGFRGIQQYFCKTVTYPRYFTSCASRA